MQTFAVNYETTTDLSDHIHYYCVIILLQGFIIYDDGCHLKKYSINPSRATATTTTEHITKLNIVIDRFHFTNHVDKWCHTNCNPYSFI